jgi:hypothetical protein
MGYEQRPFRRGPDHAIGYTREWRYTLGDDDLSLQGREWCHKPEAWCELGIAQSSRKHNFSGIEKALASACIHQEVVGALTGHALDLVVPEVSDAQEVESLVQGPQEKEGVADAIGQGIKGAG